MSLTSFLKLKDVTQKFREMFPKPKFRVERKLLCPPLTRNYSLVGAAFDYLMRFYLKYLNPHAVERKWVAEKVMQKTTDGLGEVFLVGDPLDVEIVSEGLPQARERYAEFLKSGKVTSQLIESCLLLAQLDLIVRISLQVDNLGVIDKSDVQDLRNLISRVEAKTFRSTKVCLLNPTFGEPSGLVGGADADVVLDGMLIDLKTTKNPQLQTAAFHQLIGYYVLYRLGGLDGMPTGHQINKLAVYFSRHAYLHVMDVDTIIKEEDLPDFMNWFEKRAQEEFKKKRKPGPGSV